MLYAFLLERVDYKPLFYTRRDVIFRDIKKEPPSKQQLASRYFQRLREKTSASKNSHSDKDIKARAIGMYL